MTHLRRTKPRVFAYRSKQMLFRDERALQGDYYASDLSDWLFTRAQWQYLRRHAIPGLLPFGELLSALAVHRQPSAANGIPDEP